MSTEFDVASSKPLIGRELPSKVEKMECEP
jgi:hypothetical protein